MTALYQQILQMKSARRLFLFLAFAVLLSCLLPETAHAESLSRRLNASTVKRGYTMKATDGAAKIAIWPDTVQEAVSLRLEMLSSDTYPIPGDLALVSNVWVFDILKQNTDQKSPLVLAKPIGISLMHSSHTLYRKRVFYWDGVKAQWVPLASTPSADAVSVFVRTRFPYAAVAVFEDRKAVEGSASWFRHRYDDTAASNDFPMGSRLRVTNLETKKSVLATVRSNGPFVPGRVVDLASTAFQKIHPLWRGVTRVRVELISG